MKQLRINPYRVGDVLSIRGAYFRVVGKGAEGTQLRCISNAERQMWEGIQRAMAGWRFAV